MSEVKVNVMRMRLEDLTPADYNPRTMTDEAYDGLGHSMERFGILDYIVWNQRSGNIVGGHQRYKQLLEMGEKETDVVVVDLDDGEEVALNITLNNKEIRGDFTKDVIEQLRISEAQLGNSFRDIGLFDLYDYLRSRGFDKQKREKKMTTTEVKEKKSKPKDFDSEKDEEPILPPPIEEKPQAMITCPKCQSQWKLTNNEVVFNAVTGTGKPLGVK